MICTGYLAFKVTRPQRHRHFRTVTVALGIGCLVSSSGIVFSKEKLAQANPKAVPAKIAPRQEINPVKQIALTEQQIQGFIAASQGINAVTDNSPEDIDRLSAKTVAELDIVAKRNGLSSYEEYKNIDENIGLITAGFDPVTKKYIGREAVIKVQIARALADKKLSPEDKKEKLTDIKDQLQFRWPAIKNKANIGLVAKYLDKLAAIARGD